MPVTLTYCSVADVRAYTNNPDLADDDIVSDAVMENKIVAAEVYIDAYAGYWDRAGGVTQARKFPRVEDNAIEGDVPQAILLATVAQVEFMHVNMPDLDHGIEQDASPTAASISPRAKNLMKGYRRTTGRIVLPETQNPNTL